MQLPHIFNRLTLESSRLFLSPTWYFMLNFFYVLMVHIKILSFSHQMAEMLKIQEKWSYHIFPASY